MKKRRKQPKRSKRILLLLLLLLLGLVYSSNAPLDVERADIVLPALPDSFDGYRIALVSDLHGADPQRLLRCLEQEKPDCIAVVGDLVDESTENAVAYASDCGASLCALAPTYFVTGNHEWASRQAEQICAALEAAGVRCLRNETAELERDGQLLLLAGIDDPNGYADQKTPAELAQEISSEYGPSVCWILLAHRNDRFVQEYAPLCADLTLSGHGHGGLIRLPFTDGLVSTQRHGRAEYTSGYYVVGESPLFVSRGLGNVGWTFRLGNPFHLPVLTLRCQ